ncbi:MAG TPA: YihY/virulence factor BrkB family protein [Ktedonobacterales bacterium]|jgi:YihY family inner membrane protein
MSLAQQPTRDELRQHNPERQPQPQHSADEHSGGEHPRNRHEAKAIAHSFANFWKKVNNDWVFNLSAMLAYNLLMSIFPLLALLLALFGLFLGGLGKAAQDQFIAGLTNGIPGGGGELIQGALHRLAQGSGVFAIISLVVSAWFGSRLFVAIENCFGIIFRLPSRSFVRQNLIALGMLLIFVVLIPILLAVSALPSFLSTTVVQRLFGPSTATTILLLLISLVVGYIIATVLFLTIYMVLPNRSLRIQDAWRGALIAGALLEVYVVAFPFYAAQFLKPDSYGSTAGFAVLILVFFYYFGVILLLGAEINSFWTGQRQTDANLPGILYELQVRNSADGAAGPTAGHPRENLQADRTGLDLTMTPAEQVLQPPGMKKDKDGERESPPQAEQDAATPTPS